jgi:hypothetical protein
MSFEARLCRYIIEEDFGLFTAVYYHALSNTAAIAYKTFKIDCREPTLAQRSFNTKRSCTL